LGKRGAGNWTAEEPKKSAQVNGVAQKKKKSGRCTFEKRVSEKKRELVAKKPGERRWGTRA